MSDTKILQMILDTVSAFRRQVTAEFVEVRKDIKKLDEKIDGVEQRLTKRIDKLGNQLAYLEDDTPTREEFDSLEDRVVKVEKRIAS
jgi:hypothetical protein